MKGKYNIILHTSKVRYEFEIDRKITIIKGNSGTGKTTLVRYIEMLVTKGNSLVKCNIKDMVRVIPKYKEWKGYLLSEKDKIFFIDEDIEFVKTKEFSDIVNRSDNYFVIITRASKGLEFLTYSVKSVIELGSERKGSVTVNRAYNRFINSKDANLKPSIIVTEDSRSGNNMAELAFNCDIISCNGKDNAYKVISDLFTKGYTSVYLIVDGAGFGSCMDRVCSLQSTDNLYICANFESFEYMLLCLENNRGELSDYLNHTYNYCDAAKFLTWEQYYTVLLNKVCIQKHRIPYLKSKLSSVYRTNKYIEGYQNMFIDLDDSCFKEIN